MTIWYQRQRTVFALGTAAAIAVGGMLVPGIALASSKAANLTVNPSIETDTSGWVGWQSSITRVQANNAPDGNYVARVAQADGTAYSIDDDAATVASTIEGARYKASAYVSAGSESTVGKRVTLVVRESNAAGEVVNWTTASATLSADTFTKVRVSTKAEGSGNKLEVYAIQESDAVSGDSFYIDAVSVTRVNADSANEPTDSTSTEPTEPTTAPTVEPVTLPVEEPVVEEPVTEPVVEPVAEPVTEPTTPTVDPVVADSADEVEGWTASYSEDFTQDAALGQFGSVYGQEWNGYSGFGDTADVGQYTPDKVLSVHDSALDFYLHSENGVPLVAAPMPDGYNGSTYGRYSLRFKSDNIEGYKIAFLLWPTSDDWNDGEIDWPEGDLAGVMSPASAQKGTYSNGKMTFDPPVRTYSATDATDWHTATTEWTPGLVQFFWDGVLVGETTVPSGVPDAPMRWTLQAETNLDGKAVPADASGHILIDWVKAWTYNQ